MRHLNALVSACSVALALTSGSVAGPEFLAMTGGSSHLEWQPGPNAKDGLASQQHVVVTNRFDLPTLSVATG